MSSATSRQPAELPTLTGLRIVMALWVMGFHFQPWMAPLQVANAASLAGHHVPLVQHGFLGVDFFFILSGFILTHVYGERFAAREPGLWRHFLWLRFARVWPAYFVALLVVAALKFVAFRTYGAETLSRPPDSWLGELAIHTLMLQSWGLGEPNQFNVPAWSVSCEWAAYLAFPLFFWIAAVLRTNAMRIAALALLMVAILLFALSRLPALWPIDAIGILGMPRLVCEFLAGVILRAMILPAGDVRSGRIGDRALLAGLVVAFLLPSLLPHVRVTDALVLPLLGLSVWGAAAQGPLARRLFAGRTMVFLGEASYSIYLVQWLFVATAGRYLTRVADPWIMLAAALALMVLAVAAGIALHLLVEKPARQALRRLDRSTAGAA